MSEPNESPPVDPERVVVAYRQARAHRRARVEHRRRRKWAGVRFRLTLLLLTAAAIGIAYAVWLELRQFLGG